MKISSGNSSVLFPMFDTDKLGKLENHVLKIETQDERGCVQLKIPHGLYVREINFYCVGVDAHFEVCLLISWNDL